MIGGRGLYPGRPARAVAAALAVMAAAFGPASAETGDGAEGFVPIFEERSNRLSPFDAARLDRLAGRMTLVSGYRLVLRVPADLDPAARRFTAARLAVLRQELSRRGLIAQVSYGPAGGNPDAAIALRLVAEGADLPPSSPEPAAPSSVPPTPAAETPPAIAPAPPIALVPAAVPVAETPPEPPGMPPALSAVAAADPVPAVAVEDTWTARVGETLQSVLKTWGDLAGWTVVWQSDRDYPVDAQATFSGDFTSAASQLLDGFATAVPAPYAHLYRGNHVILVQSGEGR